VLRDLDSTNGTFVNDQQVALHNLRHNDMVLIGKHTLIFEHPESLKAGSSTLDDYEVAKTRIIDTSAFRDMSQKSGGQSSEPPEKGKKTTMPGQEQSFFSRLLKRLFG
jgi:pSer/pThr/pTyr-binding forkhead associated (FHA) protein